MRKLLINLLLVLGLTGYLQAQSSQQWKLIEEKEFVDNHYDDWDVSFVLPGSKNPVIRYNPASLLMSSMMYVYQRVLSVQISSGCSYDVSCSNFSKSAIKEFGLIKGMALSADRLSRCNKLSAYDLIVSDLDFEKQKVKDDLSQYRWKH